MTVLATRRIPFARPWLTEEDRRAVLDVLEGPILTHGPQGQAFEAEFSAMVGEGTYSVAVSSCMAALHLTYIALGIGLGDEVIVPAQTHTATVHAVEWVGARPVFVDCDPSTGNVTAGAVAAAISPRTKAVSVVHFLGIPCAMPEIMAVAARHHLKVIEDCALALGARYGGTHVGLFGDVGCFSFYPAKHITTGEGGMLVTRHAAVAQAVARLRAFGVDRSHSERAVPGLYDVPALGLNYRMSELQAALGRSQLARLSESLSRRAENFHQLQRALQGVSEIRILDAVGSEARSSHYCLSVVLEDGSLSRRDEVVSRLNAAGIGTSIYYPHPVPRLAYYRAKYGEGDGRWPCAEALSDRSLALPVGPHVGQEDVTLIGEQLIRALDETSRCRS